MAQEFVDGVARIAFSGTYAGTNWANVFHWEKDEGGGYLQEEVDQLALEARGFYVSHFLPVMMPSAILQNTTVTDLTNILGVVGVDSVSAPGLSPGGFNLPANVAAVISWKIARHYRGGHPRTYLTGCNQDFVQDGRTWKATALQNYQDAADSFLIGLNGIQLGATDKSGGMVTVHRYAGGVVLQPPVVSPIVAAEVDTRIDSMRRRLGPDVSG